MADETRTQLMQTARSLFAAKGFYGASLANIADELGLTKQTLLHHFRSKEQLYGEMLLEVSERMLGLIESAKSAGTSPQEQLQTVLIMLYESAASDPRDSQIIMRELLDSERRIKEVRSWYLKPFLDGLVDICCDISGQHRINREKALAYVYSLLGAVNYFVISEIVLAGMYGRENFGRTQAAYLPIVRQQVLDVISELEEL